MKSKEELIEKWENYKNGARTVADMRAVEYADKFINDLNQLDEPEVLSQELPVIPKFVADWYENEGNRNSWWNWFYKWGRDESRSELETKTIRWMQDYNEEAFVDMFRYGYEVEEEQKYRVLDGNTTLLGRINGLMLTTVEILEYYPEYAPTFDFTEQEIKDYDERFWPFAKPVDEISKALSDIENNRVDTYKSFDELLEELER